MLLTGLSSFSDVIIAIVGAINIFAFAICAYDKIAAKRKARRIPEKVLLGVSLLFGSAGMLISMLLFRHKTRKVKFVVTVPLFLVLQAFALYFTGVIS